jgi:hypothetical protein
LLAPVPSGDRSSSRSYRRTASVAFVSPSVANGKIHQCLHIKIATLLAILAVKTTPVTIGKCTEAIRVQLMSMGVRLISIEVWLLPTLAATQ